MGITERCRLGGKAPPCVAALGYKPKHRSLARPYAAAVETRGRLGQPLACDEVT